MSASILNKYFYVFYKIRNITIYFGIAGIVWVKSIV